MTEGVDYSFARPGGAALAAAGKTFAARYLTGGGSKAIDAAELRDLQSHDVAIVAVFESTADRALGGSPAGAIDGTAAKYAAAKLGIPADRPIYFAVDFDAQPAQQLSIDAYLRGAASVIGADRVGVYGGINVISRCRANGSARWYWQTYAWSAGKVAPWAHLLQYLNGQTINGGEVDLCRSLADDFGQWPHKETAVQTTFVITSTAKVGSIVVKGGGHYYLRLADGTLSPAPEGWAKPFAIGPISLKPPIPGGAAGADRATAYLVGDEAAAFLASDVTFTPAPAPVADCTDARAAEHELVRAAAIKAAEAL